MIKPRPLKAFTVTDPDYLPGGFPIPFAAAAAVGNVPDHVRQCRVIITALDATQADNMLAQCGLLRKGPVTEADAYEADAMRAAGLFAQPMVWLLIWVEGNLVVVQVFPGGNMERVGRIIGVGVTTTFEAAPEPAAPAGVSREVIDWTTKRHRDALASAITEAREDLSHLPTKLLRGGHISGELNGIIGRLVDAAGRARALEALDEILPKN